MMAAERSFEAWEEVQRHGQDLADRLAQGFTGLIQSHIPPPPFPWPPTPPTPKLFDLDLLPPSTFVKPDFKLYPDTFNSSLLDIGTRIGRASTDLGTSLDGFLHQFLRGLPLSVPGFKLEEGLPHDEASFLVKDLRNDSGVGLSLAGRDEAGCLDDKLRGFAFVNGGDDVESSRRVGGNDEVEGDDAVGFSVRGLGHIGKPQGTVNVTSTYNSRTQKVDSSFTARGDSWRVEASRGSSTSGNDSSSLFLLQLGPVLFVRGSTLLLPVHLSKQHLLWYGYDRKNGIHSLCPAIWSKHRRWLLMSMLCLSPLACSFVDLQFPNGQFTYVSGEGLTTSAFLPFCGGLLQAEGQYPGEMRFSFSRKNKWGTRITPMVQLPDKSFSLGVAQSLAWKRSGIMFKPTVEISLCPTFGGSNPGLHAEIIHSIKERLSLISGCSFVTHPSAFASVSVGRSKWNGNVGSSGVVLRVDAPLCNFGRPSFSIQINSGMEF
ncbi:hypothetical protein MLD38_034151 [Melastoma candidum]|uniref:Uncharacterized protein n=1 Tax=Melastoma candidum TaxID=119954 RepID=A0ACB9M8T4_9MYRT|nr:hypothetical protein MLD38_034151 [Melastoma candidum]